MRAIHSCAIFVLTLAACSGKSGPFADEPAPRTTAEPSVSEPSVQEQPAPAPVEPRLPW